MASPPQISTLKKLYFWCVILSMYLRIIEFFVILVLLPVTVLMFGYLALAEVGTLTGWFRFENFLTRGWMGGH